MTKIVYNNNYNNECFFFKKNVFNLKNVKDTQSS